MKQIVTVIKGEIENSTVMVWDFNTPFAPINKSCRSKLNKEKLVLSNTLDQIYTEHSIQMQSNTHSVQVHMKHSPG